MGTTYDDPALTYDGPVSYDGSSTSSNDCCDKFAAAGATVNQALDDLTLEATKQFIIIKQALEITAPPPPPVPIKYVYVSESVLSPWTPPAGIILGYMGTKSSSTGKTPVRYWKPVV